MKQTPIPKEDAKAWRNEAKRLRKSLSSLTEVSYAFLDHMDALMRLPSTVERGRAMAKAMNALNFETDAAHHFGLGKPFRKPRNNP